MQPTERPVIDEVIPSPVPAARNEVVLRGKHFQDGAVILIDGQTEIPAIYESETQLKATFDASTRPQSGVSVKLRVKNPRGVEPLSGEIQVEFE